MRINDLESQISFKYQKKFVGLQKLVKSYQKNFDLLMTKYNSLKEKQNIASSPTAEKPTAQKDASTKPARLNRSPTASSSKKSPTASMNLNAAGCYSSSLEDIQSLQTKDESALNTKFNTLKLKQWDEIYKQFEGNSRESLDTAKTLSNRAAHSFEVPLVSE